MTSTVVMNLISSCTELTMNTTTVNMDHSWTSMKPGINLSTTGGTAPMMLKVNTTIDRFL